MRRIIASVIVLVGLLSSAMAAVPPAEQLLPPDTLVMWCVPDWSKVAAAQKESPVCQLWRDPALQPFRDKFLAKLRAEVLQPLEGGLGIKLTNYTALLQGQCTLAMTRNGWTGTKDPLPAFILLLDAKDKAGLLKANLAEVKQKLLDAGKSVKTDRIRDVEFTTVVADLAKLGQGVQKAMPSGPPAPPPVEKKDQPADQPKPEPKEGPKLEVSFGQVDSLLVAGTSAKELERVLVRLAGGAAPCLSEQAGYQASYQACFREALSYGWVNLAPVVEIFTKAVAAAPNPNPFGPPPERLFGALGVNSLKTLALGARQTSEGEFVDLFLGVPEDGRRGLFKLLATEAKEAGPPPFVPADAVQFYRWRLDGQKAWAALEAMFNELTPGTFGMVTQSLESGLKQRDPDFGLQKNLIANLGDDLISYQKVPRTNSLAELSSPPALFLVGSANADALTQAAKAVLTFIAAQTGGGQPQEREFLGRKIWTAPLPQLPTAAAAKSSALHLSASGGYLALSTDAALLEEYLRSSDSKPKPLAETPGLADAAQKIGGTATGLFGCQDDRENMRALFEALKNDQGGLGKFFAATPFAAVLRGPEMEKVFKEWVDFSLLPPYEKVAKYFYLSVFAGRTTPEGFGFKAFSPLPPTMKQ
jgi:hypothetical protein